MESSASSGPQQPQPPRFCRWGWRQGKSISMIESKITMEVGEWKGQLDRDQCAQAGNAWAVTVLQTRLWQNCRVTYLHNFMELAIDVDSVRPTKNISEGSVSLCANSLRGFAFLAQQGHRRCTTVARIVRPATVFTRWRHTYINCGDWQKPSW